VLEQGREGLVLHRVDLEEFAPRGASAAALSDDDLGLVGAGDVAHLEEGDLALVDAEVVEIELLALAEVGADDDDVLVPEGDAFALVVSGEVGDELVLGGALQALFFGEGLFDAALGVDGQPGHPGGLGLGAGADHALGRPVVVVVADGAPEPAADLGRGGQGRPGDEGLAGHVAGVAVEDVELEGRVAAGGALGGEGDDHGEVVLGRGVGGAAHQLVVGDIGGDVEGLVVGGEGGADLEILAVAGVARDLLVEGGHGPGPLGEHAVELDRAGLDQVEGDGQAGGVGPGGQERDGQRQRGGRRAEHGGGM